ncbi:MAG: S26 family signal peptidase, partial [Bdellovibrionales bacterium]|nr:S26 family signal peptidase [Bdellovibrionales bacterium]
RIDDRYLLLEPVVETVAETVSAENTRSGFAGDSYSRFKESCLDSSENKGAGARSHTIQLAKYYAENPLDEIVYSVVVPEGELAVFGDNRHESADSRIWGTVPKEDLLGQAKGIWLSCESSLPGFARVCSPATLRWERMFRGLDGN